MKKRVKRTIALPAELARYVDKLAASEGRTPSAIIANAMRLQQLHRLQEYWSRIARAKGVVSEAGLERYLGD